MSRIDNIIIQVRARLQELAIKLWLEPYYFADIGSVESEIDRLAEDFSHGLGISVSNCKLALTELQDGALRKLEARKEFEETGMATFSVRRINNQEGTQTILEVKCDLNALGSELAAKIATKLQLNDANQIKCISLGKIIDPDRPLSAQGLKNNQQLMVIISEIDKDQSNSKEAMYDRIRKIKMDVEKIVDSKQQLFEMEDQDGNAIFLPPNENRALLIAMSLCEKARAAMKRQHYDEALILLLEADERFTTCNSKFLESVDNYALVNLDIVWCYLCLKNVTQLPDAARRLEICERSFRRSYGENLERLLALKGNSCPERALIMRLHLLQGVVFFHQNNRNEAYAKLVTASAELHQLKVNEDDVLTLVQMGYEPFEARLGLRSCSGDVVEAVNFIIERKQKLEESRKRSEKERKANQQLKEEHLNDNEEDEGWVNPRSLCTLVDMGFDRQLVVEALKLSKNNVTLALDMLQTRVDELRKNLPPKQTVASDTLVSQLEELGFNEQMIQAALQVTQNDMEKAIDYLVKSFRNEDELLARMERMAADVKTAADADTAATDGPSTSRGQATLLEKVVKKVKRDKESLKAYQRFNEDITDNEFDYLDLPLVQEEQILADYQRLLEQ